jgi:hypothetical protein
VTTFRESDDAMMKTSDLTRVRDVLVCCSGYVNALTLNTHFHAASGECTSHHFKGLLWVGGSADCLPVHMISLLLVLLK